MTNSWFLLSIIALLLYGSWGFWGAKAAPLIDSTSASFYSSLGVLLAGLICLSMLSFKPPMPAKGTLYSVLNGFSTGIACIFFIAALKRGPAVPVVMITALYPIVTTIMCVIFLEHQLSTRQILGIICTMMALFLFAE